MMDQKIINEYARWKQLVTEDADLARELGEIDGKEDQIVDAFYRDLEFGTGGLRGVIGAGKGVSGPGGLCDQTFPGRAAADRGEL